MLRSTKVGVNLRCLCSVLWGPLLDSFSIAQSKELKVPQGQAGRLVRFELPMHTKFDDIRAHAKAVYLASILNANAIDRLTATLGESETACSVPSSSVFDFADGLDR